MNFKNSAPTDFSISSKKDAFQAAIDSVNSSLKNKIFSVVPLVNAKAIKSESKFIRENPSNFSEKIAEVVCTPIAACEHIVDSLLYAKKDWSQTSLSKRATLLRKVADILDAKHYIFCALMTKEVGKPWKEADADLAEAIDFCNYYAELAEKTLSPYRTQELKGEDNTLNFFPKGIAVIIPPWNFPVAIPCGMIAAALVTGNTVAFKPAEQSSLIAQELALSFYEAGFPVNTLAFLPGIGEEIGAALVKHPKINIIAFTGSKSVGLNIIYEASIIRPGQTAIKKVIAEMGGKNCIIVDEDADLDEAIRGIIYSAFGYAGQKCSACSRVIVHASCYERLTERLVEASNDIIIGNSENSATFLGPVIDKDSFNRINQTIFDAKKELTCGTTATTSKDGYFIAPHIFLNVLENNKIWTDEIFGPVLAINEAKNFGSALVIANNSAYALTGAVYSRSPKNIELAKQEFEVGNLYINRGCTGAIVQRQAFGGHKLSGMGEKAGGPNYLIQFVQAKSIAENTIRKGFVP